MFGKLIKNEFRGTWKFMAAIFAAFAVMTLLGCISIQALIHADNLGPLPVLTFILYILSFAVVFFGLLIDLSNRYYKTMYSTQGYLTHTLPASEHSIFASKLMVSAIWMLAGTLLMLCSVFILGDVTTEGDLHRTVKQGIQSLNNGGVIVDEDGTLVQINNGNIIVEEDGSRVSITSNGIFVEDDTGTISIGGSGVTVYDADDFSEKFLQNIERHPKRISFETTLWLLLNTILSECLLLLWIFASMAIGQLSDKHRTFVAILAAIGFYILNQIAGVSAIVEFVSKVEIWSSLQIFKRIVFGVPMYLLLIDAVLVGICLLINHKKLNLA